LSSLHYSLKILQWLQQWPKTSDGGLKCLLQVNLALPLFGCFL
jgi:hypothetical protein